MLELRTVAAQGASDTQLTAAVEHARSLLDRAHGTRADETAALIGALTITLREGVEIVLLIAALLGLVRKRGHPELGKYVHAGWLLAVPAGLLTFLGAESLLSGMQRELAEGIASLLAALVRLQALGRLSGEPHRRAGEQPSRRDRRAGAVVFGRLSRGVRDRAVLPSVAARCGRRGA
jgi:hypothetical protein